MSVPLDVRAAAEAMNDGIDQILRLHRADKAWALTILMAAMAHRLSSDWPPQVHAALARENANSAVALARTLDTERTGDAMPSAHEPGHA